MSARASRELVDIAEQYRSLVPQGFLAEVDTLASDLVQNRPVVAMRSKGRRGVAFTNARIKAAILDEISLFLCTDDARYEGLRGEGRELGKDAVHFIAGIVVGTLGLASGVATGCVAFVALACAKVGIGTFCRLNPPALAEHSGTTSAPATEVARR